MARRECAICKGTDSQQIWGLEQLENLITSRNETPRHNLEKVVERPKPFKTL